jgi:hypothetical protein
MFDMGRAEVDSAADWLQKAVQERDTRFVLLTRLIRTSQPTVFLNKSKWKALAHSLGVPTGVAANR